MIEYLLFGKFHIYYDDDDWDFMCNHRWFSDNPSVDEMEAEFDLCGLRDAKDDTEANLIVKNTISALRKIMYINLSEKCKNLLKSNVNLIAHIDNNNNI